MRYQHEMGEQMESAHRRKAERREDLLRIAGAMGIPRTNLSTPSRWTEVARESLSYEPDRALVAMIRDVARTARQRCTPAQQQAVRRAITLYIGRTLLNDCLEPLGPQEHYTGSVLQLFNETVKETGEAECALAQAIQAPNPHTEATAARELEEAAVVTGRAAESLRERAARKWDSITNGRMW